MRRVVLPEKLDSLPEDDPAAEANRADLRKINFMMGNFRWLRTVLKRRMPGGGEASEWAAGDGAFGAYLASREKGLILQGIDVCRRPAVWPRDWTWEQTNILEIPEDGLEGVIVGNFILHQFEDAQLATLGKRLNARAHLLIFNETARRRGALILSRLVGFVFSMHPVTKHDADVSIRGGFRGDELPELLGLSYPEWKWQTVSTWLGSYRLIAERVER